MNNVGQSFGHVVPQTADRNRLSIGVAFEFFCHAAVRERWLAGKVEGDNTFCPNAESLAFLQEQVRPL